MEGLGLSMEALKALKEFAVERGVDVDSDEEETDVISKVQNFCDIQDKNDSFNFSYGSEKDGNLISFTVNGLKREVGQTLQSTGLTLWRAAEHLSEFIFAHSDEYRNKSICELGAGLGNVSILLHLCKLNSIIVCTDGDDDTLDLLRKNMSFNEIKDSEIKVDKLYWGEEVDEFLTRCQEQLKCSMSLDEQGVKDESNDKTVFQNMIEKSCNSEKKLFDMAVGADIIYEKEQIQPLFETVSQILKRE